MAVIARDGRVAIEKSGFDHKYVGIASVLGQTLGGFGIAHDDELLLTLRRPQDVFGIDRSTVRQRHRPSFRQLLTQRGVRHAEGCEAVWPKMTAGPANKGEAEAVSLAMPYRKATDSEVAGIEHLARRQRGELQRNGRSPLAPQAREHSGDDVEGARTSVNRHDIRTLPQSQSRKEAGNAEHVVEMPVRQQEPAEPPEAGAAPEQLALRALPTIDNDAMAAGFHQKAWMIALRRWDAGRGSEKGQIEHDRGDTLIGERGRLPWRRRRDELYPRWRSP